MTKHWLSLTAAALLLRWHIRQTRAPSAPVVLAAAAAALVLLYLRKFLLRVFPAAAEPD